MPTKESLRERARQGANSASNRARGGLMAVAPKPTALEDPPVEVVLQPELVTGTAGDQARALQAEPAGEFLVKFTLDLPPTLVRRLTEFRLARLRATGHDEPLERLIDAALGELSLDPAAAVALAERLPEELAAEKMTGVGCRLRASVRDRLRELRLLLRLASPDLHMRRVYAAAVWEELERQAARI
jgi:hypothetical protein